MYMVHQGDVMLVKLDDKEEIAPGFSVKRDPDGLLVLAHGESGHRHGIAVKSANLIDNAEGQFLIVKTITPLTHEEHETITLEPGRYGVFIQHSYERKQIQRVID